MRIGIGEIVIVDPQGTFFTDMGLVA